MEEEKPDVPQQDSAPQPSAPTKNNDEIVRKIIFSLCYLWGILFFIPLILYKNDKNAVRHANEGLLLLILSAAGNVLFGLLTLIGGIFKALFSIIAPLYSLALLVLGIIGIVFVVTDRDEPLPIIGGIQLIK